MSSNEPPPVPPSGDQPHQPPHQPPQAPSYGAPSSGDPSPSAPSYGTPSYGAPSHDTPSYGAAPGHGGPPGAPAYGHAAPAGSRWNLGDAVGYGWKKFQENVGQILLAALALLVAMGVMTAIGLAIQGAVLQTAEIRMDPVTGQVTSVEGSGMVATLAVTALVGALILVAALVVGAGLVRGSLAVTEGRPFKVSDVFSTDRLGAVVSTALIVAGLTFVGLVLCYLPGLVVGFVTSYSLYFVIDQGLGPVDAIKASVNLVKDNFGDTIIWYLVGGLIASAGALACGVGLLVTMPIVLLGTAYTYKKLTGQQVAA